LLPSAAAHSAEQ
jgi:hypothetical protein